MKFLLDFFILITGIGAASGLHYQDNKLFIVSDNSNYLYEYHIDSEELKRHLLVDLGGVNEQVEKKHKLDLEAITYYDGQYYLLPSGSRSNRTKSFYLSPQSLDHIRMEELDSSYVSLRTQLSIASEDFNIEGAIFEQDTVLLFNRGNGPLEKNGIIRFPFSQHEKATFNPITLPTINGKTTGFTDALLLDDKIYFLAAAEGGNSSYNDGEIGGSQVGVINLADLTLEQVETISFEHKFEGITLYTSTAEETIFLLCEDPDNGKDESTIYQLKIKK